MGAGPQVQVHVGKKATTGTAVWFSSRADTVTKMDAQFGCNQKTKYKRLINERRLGKTL